MPHWSPKLTSRWLNTHTSGRILTKSEATPARQIYTAEDTEFPGGLHLPTMQQQVKLLIAHLEVAENRLLCNNTHWLSLVSRGLRPHCSYSGSLPQALVPDKGISHICSGEARVVPTGHLILWANPWPFLVWFLSYKDQNTVLAAARKKGQLDFEDISFSSPLTIFFTWNPAQKKIRCGCLHMPKS